MQTLFSLLLLILAASSNESSNVVYSILNEGQPHKEVILQKGAINKQITQENTTYIISRKCDLKEKVKGISLDSPIIVNGQKYYTHDESISLAEGQRIWIPKRCVLLNENREMLSSGVAYRPKSQCNVFFASNYRRTVSYKKYGKLVIPKNCTLKFTGGKIINGCILGQATKIEASDNTLFDNVAICGEWDCPVIKSEWFADAETINGLKNVFALSNNKVYNTIEIEPGEYIVSHTSYDDTPIKPKSNTTIVLNGDIIEQANSLKEYYTVYIKDVQNLIIEGNGRIIGDREKHHKDIEGEKGHGITIQNSKDVTIRGITVQDCWGDCIYVGTSATNRNIKIDNCRIIRGRRTGIAIVNVDGYKITNCSISNIGGTPTEYGIDVEPNVHPSHVCKNGVIEGNIFDTKLGLYIQGQKDGRTQKLAIKNNTFNCSKKAICLAGGEDVDFADNIISSEDVAVHFISVPNVPRSAVFSNNVINGTIRGSLKDLRFIGNAINGICYFEEDCENVLFKENHCHGLVNFAGGKGGNEITGNIFEYPLEVRMSSSVINNHCNDVISCKDCTVKNNIITITKPKMNRQNSAVDLNNCTFSNNEVTLEIEDVESITSVFRLLTKASVISGNTLTTPSQKIPVFTVDPNIKEKTTLSKNSFTKRTVGSLPTEQEKKLLWK